MPNCTEKVLALALVVACSRAPVVRSQDDVVAALDDFHDAAAKADEGRYFGHFAPDGVFLGTDQSERWDAVAFRVYAHPHFAKGKAWSFRGVRRRIAVRGDTAWFEEDLETQNLGPARGSGVLAYSGEFSWATDFDREALKQMLKAMRGKEK